MFRLKKKSNLGGNISCQIKHIIVFSRWHRFQLIVFQMIDKINNNNNFFKSYIE